MAPIMARVPGKDQENMAKHRTVRRTLASRSQFSTDLIPEDASWVRVLRSEISLGKLLSIEIPDLPEGAGIIRAQDIPGSPLLEFFDENIPLLVEEDIHYRGQPLALVYARTEDEALALAGNVKAVYEVQGEPVFEPGASSLHAHDVTSWESQGSVPEDEEWEIESLENGEGLDAGAPEQAVLDPELEESQEIQEDEEDPEPEALEQELSSVFELASQYRAVQEPITAIAQLEDSVLVILAPALWPHHVSRCVQQVLKARPSQIEVRSTIPGRYHDRLLVDGPILSCFVALVARKTGKTAVISLDHEEEVKFATNQAEIRCEHRVKIHPMEGLTEVDILFQVNMGAFPLFSREIMNQILGSAHASYRSGRGRVRVEIHKTNLNPMSVFHGFLSGQAQICTEIQINRIAHLLRLDPMDLRMGILARLDQDFQTWKEPPSSITLLPALKGASDFSRKFSSFEILRKRGKKKRQMMRTEDFLELRGIGTSLGFQGNSFSMETEKELHSRIQLVLEQNGRVRLHAGTTPGSPAIKAHFRDYLKDQFSIPNDHILISPVHSSLIPDNGPMTLSRNLSVTQKLLEQAVASVQKRRFRDPLPISVSKSFQVPRTRKSVPYPWLPTSWAATVVEVRVDPVTYLPSVSEIWMAIQAGAILNLGMARGHVQGAVIQTLGWALNQRWQLEDGILVPALASGFGPAGLMRTPKIHIDFYDDEGLPIGEGRLDYKDGPYPRGIGELAQASIPAALLNALSQATGQYFDRIPITPELIHQYMEADSHED